MRFWVGFSDKMTTSEIRKNVNKPQVWMPHILLWLQQPWLSGASGMLKKTVTCCFLVICICNCVLIISAIFSEFSVRSSWRFPFISFLNFFQGSKSFPKIWTRRHHKIVLYSRWDDVMLEYIMHMFFSAASERATG